MKVDKKDEYFAFQSKLIRRVCMNVITSIVVVVGLYQNEQDCTFDTGEAETLPVQSSPKGETAL